MHILDIRQEIEKNLAEMKVIDSLISAFMDLNNQSMQKIARYKDAIDGANKDQRYGLVLDYRDAINKEIAEINDRVQLIRERERQKNYLTKRNDELRSALRSTVLSFEYFEARSQKTTYSIWKRRVESGSTNGKHIVKEDK